MRLRWRVEPWVAVLLAVVVGGRLAFAQTGKEWLPPTPTGQQWKLIWRDEFDGKELHETKWNRLGDWKRCDGWWVKQDAYVNGKGSLILRTRKDGERYDAEGAGKQGSLSGLGSSSTVGRTVSKTPTPSCPRSSTGVAPWFQGGSQLVSGFSSRSAARLPGRARPLEVGSLWAVYRREAELHTAAFLIPARTRY